VGGEILRKFLVHFLLEVMYLKKELVRDPAAMGPVVPVGVVADDEYNFQSCMAVGKGFVHMNSHGFVESCLFTRVDVHSVKDYL